MRVQDIENRYRKLIKEKNYEKLWISVHTQSAEASTMPHPDTLAVLTFSMILECIARIDELRRYCLHVGDIK